MIIILKNDISQNITKLQKLFAGKKQVLVQQNRVAVVGAAKQDLPAEIQAAAQIIENTPAAI